MDEATKETAEPPPREGTTTELPHDRTTVERLRKAFPRAGWSDTLNAWFVPGCMAEKRIGRWLANWRLKLTDMPTRREGTPLHSSLSKAATLKRRQRRRTADSA